MFPQGLRISLLNNDLDQISIESDSAYTPEPWSDEMLQIFLDAQAEDSGQAFWISGALLRARCGPK